MKRLVSTLVLVFSIFTTSSLQAQQVTTEKRFQDLFTTASYGTAFGAAMGAAVLSFQKKPDENLRFVAIGASIGFITGSLFGSYIVFSPVFEKNQALLDTPTQFEEASKFAVKPILSSENFGFEGVVGEMKIASF